MENSKKWMKEGGYDAKISFNDLQPHTVKLLKDKLETITVDNKDVKGMKYLVEEDGEQKTIFTGSVGLVSKLAEVETGSVVTIQMSKRNNKSYYTVTKADGSAVESGDPTVQIDEEQEVPLPNPDF